MPLATPVGRCPSHRTDGTTPLPTMEVLPGSLVRPHRKRSEGQTTETHLSGWSVPPNTLPSPSFTSTFRVKPILHQVGTGLLVSGSDHGDPRRDGNLSGCVRGCTVEGALSSSVVPVPVVPDCPRPGSGD